MYGQRIRQLRKEHKMTQEALAKRLNKAKSTISQYENEINEPDIDTLSQMAQIFNVSIDFISGKSSNRSDHETQDYDYTNDPTVTGELRELLDILNSLPPDKQVDIIQQALTYAAGIKARNRSTQK
ncbi:helix-turn-helix domain-containing protein [Brevibacillus sp. SYSU BS000544]|uniref:helix-turn-helix domain-containing protein n=1 Tax=Brevibacillus sp. SYSU BS000544 TaxID=3416443 RepID=UPI003CE48F5C